MTLFGLKDKQHAGVIKQSPNGRKFDFFVKMQYNKYRKIKENCYETN